MSRDLTSVRWHIGCDVGSTAVKLVVRAPAGGPMHARLYERHGTRQTQAVVDLLGALEAREPGLLARARVFWTGSGGRVLAEELGCRYLQEVNAVALATERRHPDVGSIVDLGGQDAKIIIWQRDARTGRRRKLLSMNDKCAGGTGAVIDRIAGKLALPLEALPHQAIAQARIHPIAARCGVFAETDINGLQKQGVPPEELLASLFAAIVQQNLSVLTRGATLLPPVLLLGGPHAFLPGLVARWREALGTLWRERGVGAGADTEAAVRVPEDACYYAALGAIEHGESVPAEASEPRGAAVLERLRVRLAAPAEAGGSPGLLRSAGERQHLEDLARQAVVPGLNGKPETPLEVWIGLDAGSTSTKAVLLDARGTLLSKSYRLSAGDPLADAREVLGDLERRVLAARHRLVVRGLGITGYAKDMLGAFLGADLVLVETVAHARSALRVRADVDVIVDVGGQDIKVLTLRDGRVRDFRLNSQCSAGNGFFLQSTARRFGIGLEAFADHALSAERAPEFHFGCAVFLESDIVNFQQLGWRPGEILAGLARVLPKNIWLYVVGESNLARLGRVFLLQGGTQRNLAAVKAQVDFIRERVPAADVAVHPHTGEAGAIGVALELLERRTPEARSRFIGMEALRALRVHARTDEPARCSRCANACERTVLEGHLPGGETRRYIVAACDVGREVGPAAAGAAARGNALAPPPDLAARSQALFFQRAPRVAVGGWRESGWTAALRSWVVRRAAERARRAQVRIGMPRALSLHQVAPFFTGYLHALGIAPERIRFSGTTTEELFRRGARRGAIDTCFPAKLALGHVEDLLREGTCDWVLFPIVVNLPQETRDCVAASACPCAQATPDVVKAAFTREADAFQRAGVTYFTPVFHMAEPHLFERELLDFFGPRLGVSARENRDALAAGRQALAQALCELRVHGSEQIARLGRERRVGVVALGRPYHDDPGLNHGIFRELNRRGYTILTATALPHDAAFLARLFGSEIAAGRMGDALEIGDVWRRSFCANSNQKIWAAKVVARHPNLVALDVSSFRCGHDAPIYATIEAILEASGTPYFTFHDIDENRPAGAIRLRVETIDYFLREYEARRLGREPAVAAPPVRAQREASPALAEEVMV